MNTRKCTSVAVHIPLFILHDPERWSAMVGRSFKTAKVTIEATKFRYVLGIMDP